MKRLYRQFAVQSSSKTRKLLASALVQLHSTKALRREKNKSKHDGNNISWIAADSRDRQSGVANGIREPANKSIIDFVSTDT